MRNEAFWSRGVYPIHGLSRESFLPQAATGIELFHPRLSEDIRCQGFTHALSKPIDMPQVYATPYRCLEDDPEVERYAG